ncbi:RNA-binding protein [candidate division KSB1 bacterium]|nr:RNA-binding protein [candidate division KSB1 bacterium]NIR73239.1 RNA-binding protein [candidate division KSB1 bacterium]NIS28353.1 RNA-binding protein [candidate division KSB1 bacterium]NIT74997.1 RNA-binding protein [candidate division KSB1 bacterium]NIU29086.1 RNA-binding protein [candidate division KSB1 bacterium]
MNIYVGNLSLDVTQDDLQKAFEAFGKVETANVIRDKYSGESRGFGFVEMPIRDQAESAIKGLNGTELMGKTLKVSQARPRSQARRGGGRHGFGGGTRGGGRGGPRRW